MAPPAAFLISWDPVRSSDLSAVFGHPNHDAHCASRLQALQVLLRHIENIYLSQAGSQKTNHLGAGITNPTLCRPSYSRYTRLRLLTQRDESIHSPGDLAPLRRVRV